MKFKKIILYAVIINFSSVSFHLYGSADRSLSVEERYAQALEARYSGDNAKARFLLEELQNEGITNQTFFCVLTETYYDYLSSLIEENNTAVLQTAYPSIRRNLAFILSTYPKSQPIQKNILSISALMRDMQFGVLMSELILTKDSANVLANYFVALNLMQADCIEKAVPYFQRVATVFSDQEYEEIIFRSRVYLGDIFFQLNQIDSAVKYYYSAGKIWMTDQVIEKIAFLEAYQLNFTKSVALFQKISRNLMTSDLKDIYLAVLLGEGSKESLTCMSLILSRSMDLSPFAQALVYYQKGQTQYALDILENTQDEGIVKALPWVEEYLRFLLMKRYARVSEQYEALFNMGVFAFTAGNDSKAWEYLYPIRNDSEYQSDIHFILAKISYFNQNWEKALQFYTKAVAFSECKENIEIYSDIIQIYITKKDFKNAERWFARMAKLPEVDNNWVRLTKAAILTAETKFSAAEKCIKKVLSDLGSNNIVVNNFLARVYILQNQYEQAEKVLEKIYHLDPMNHQILNHLAYVYVLQNKNLDKALNLSISAILMDPDSIDYLDTLAWIYFKQGQTDKAGQVFGNIENLISNADYKESFSEIFMHLAEYYRAVGNGKKSEEYFKKANFQGG
ncbi:MAG: tetratricopeptide repeat protein [Brevinemataceae bacterium]